MTEKKNLTTTIMTTQQIVLPYGKVKTLVRDFKVSYPTIKSALTGRTNSSTARMLRAAALQRGGKYDQD
jgi:hypothetical protein